MYMGITEESRKVSQLKSWARRTLVNFCEKQAMIQFETIPRIVSARGRAEVPEKPTDTFI